MLNASKPQKVTVGELPAALAKLVAEKHAETFIGALPSSQGLFVLLFSHRLNEEFSLVVAGSEPARILAKVHEVLKDGT